MRRAACCRVLTTAKYAVSSAAKDPPASPVWEKQKIKKRTFVIDKKAFLLAGMVRIELTRAESKSAVLPLDYIPLYGVGNRARTDDLQGHNLAL